MSTEVRNNTDEKRYEITRDGELAGFVTYHERPGLVALVHTEVDDRFSGQGLAGQLLRETLDDLRARDVQVLPFCPFVNAFIRDHADYLDLVPVERREAFDL